MPSGRMFEALGLDETRWVHYTLFAPGGGSTAEQAVYDNIFHLSGRSIICVNNNAANDSLRAVTGLRWSDYLAIGYSEMVRQGQHTSSHTTGAAGVSTRNLETVWRYMVANPDTQAVMRVVSYRLHDNTKVAIQSGTDEFFALLGTDNGKGVAYLLADFPQMFGRKIISHVSIPLPQTLCWTLQVYPEPAPTVRMPVPELSGASPLSNKAQRNLRRKQRQSLGSTG
ncbi:hypothetical protein PWT90_05603 [Aphanocladium album]|nr:hypothetical protein PWT90_05603 [Aphanocladium album]